jgi:uncharacterized membrane protein YfcA
VELTWTVAVVGTLATIVFGLSKTAVPAVGSFGAALLTTVLPPLASTGVVLPALIVGDVIALSLYARHVDARLVLRMLPTVALGLAGGYAVVSWVDTSIAVRLIGATLVVAGLGELARRRSVRANAAARTAEAGGDGGTDAAGPRHHDRAPVSLLLGAGAGFSTMVANAGGPMMTLYLLRLRVPTAAFLGTTAWFFFAVNVLKVPLSAYLGLITPDSLVISAALVPGIGIGALIGRQLVLGMSRAAFETAALATTSAAGLWLLLG